MKITNKTTARLIALWFLFTPIFMYVLIKNYWNPEINRLYFITLIVLGFFTVLFTIKRNGKPILLITWIAVPAFLLYGIVAEIIITQIALLANLFRKKIDANELNKAIGNSLALLLISVVSALMFFWVGGEIKSIDFWPLTLAIVVYQVTRRGLYLIGNRIIHTLKGIIDHRLRQDLLFETLIVMLLLPFTLALYYLLHYVGYGAFFLLSIPYFFIITIIRLYNEREKVNKALKQAGEIGHRISNIVDEEEVVDRFVAEVSKMFNAEHVYLLDNYDEWFETLRYYENGKEADVNTNRIIVKEDSIEPIIGSKETLFYKEKKEWVELLEDSEWLTMESMFLTPVLRNQRLEGVLIVASSRKSEFKPYQLQLAEILCSYFAVSVEKARYIESTVKQIDNCALTKLYNYNFILKFLEQENEKFKNNQLEELTVILLDIDYFKQVNDTYGHQSGNDILVELAELLQRNTPKDAIVARYGGEEFIYVLPNVVKNDALIIAETIREKIAAYSFKINSDLGNKNQEVEVNITVSMGVSGMPVDTDDVSTLIRNADRALYIGAKQAGRNRVAGYIK